MTRQSTNQQIDYIAFHRSISDELSATQNRVRHLISDHHWPSDGEQKEVVLRKTLRDHIPENYNVGRGFVCFENEPSKQIDILITQKNRPTLFKEGDFFIVTPDCVEAIVEVKTSQSNTAIRQTVNTISDEIHKIRLKKFLRVGWSGLFVFDGPKTRDRAASFSANLLPILSEAANNDVDRIINCISIGQNLFFRFWRHPVEGLSPMWRSYYFEGNHKNLSPAYFISNLALGINPPNPNEEHLLISNAYFPIQGSVGKEQHRLHGISLGSTDLIEY